MASSGERTAAVRELLVAGEATGLRSIAESLHAQGIEAGPEELRADLRRLGAVRVQGSDGPRLALPVGRDADGAAAGPGAGLPAALVADPDWPLQLAVTVVVAVFLVVGLLGWLLAP